METREFLVVNSFAEKPFGGNPAAVFPHAEGLNKETMQTIARQMNLVETVFVFPSDDADYHFRYFTPEEELPVAGHPTIATCVALVEAGMIDTIQESEYRVRTAKGICMVAISGSENTVVFMEQPKPAFGAIETRRDHTADVLGINESDILAGLPVAPVDTGLGHLIVPVKSLEALFRVQRRIGPLRELCAQNGVREVQAFAFGALDPSNHLYTRNICPREGIEDPACGVGNGALGAYLLKYYHPERKEISLRAEQGAIVNMPSVIHIKALRQGNAIRASVGGTGTVMIKGSFFIQ